jgi:hypothetical protein
VGNRIRKEEKTPLVEQSQTYEDIAIISDLDITNERKTISRIDYN